MVHKQAYLRKKQSRKSNMPQLRIESIGDESLKLEYNNDKSVDSFFKSHLLKDAIVELIGSADLGGWAKHEDTELQPDDFWKCLLIAIAESCRNESLSDMDMSNKELLHQLIDEYETLDESEDMIPRNLEVTNAPACNN
jgi:hypothetical protein